MAERATYCPRCHKMHIGVCKEVMPTATPESTTPETGAADLPKPSAARSGFDKAAYQRDYMRKRRAEAKKVEAK